MALHSDQSGVFSYVAGVSAGATETCKVLSPSRQSAKATMSGPLTNGDVLYLYVATPYPQSGSGQRYFHTVATGDTYNSILNDFATQLNADPVVQAFNASASVSGDDINLVSYNPNNQLWQVGTWTGTFTTVFGLSNVRTSGSQVTEYQRNAIGNPTQMLDPLGRKFSYSYAANNIDLLEAREIQGSDNNLLGHWEYNGFHQPTVYIDGSGRQTHYTYNSLQQPLTITDPNGNVTAMTYTGTSSATIGGTVTAGDVLTLTAFDAGLAGGQKSVNYTVLGTDTLTSIAAGLTAAVNGDSALAAVGITATAAGAVITLKSTSVNVTTYGQSTSGGSTAIIALGANTYGFLTKIDGPMPGNRDVTTMTYDGFGRLRSTRSSTGYRLVFSYDAMNRQTKTTYPDGTFDQTIWDRLDPVLQKDRIGRTTQSAYDSMDQKVLEVDPLGRKTQYKWCTCGSLAELTDGNGNKTKWHHDIQGRLTSKVYADNSTVNYSYEPFAGWLRSRTDALSQTTRYYFNPDNTPLKVGYANPVHPTGGVTYAWDLNFKRLTGINKSDWGTYSYTYNPYITNAYGTPTTGGGMLQLVHNDVIPNSDITYLYDALGRTTNRSINGAANSVTWAYDPMSRVTSEVNALGTFNYKYVDDNAGVSKGVTRLASINYPNGQVTNFDWYPTDEDERLQQIRNLGPSGNTISQFGYRYDPADQIKQWQQIQNNSSLCYSLGYDQAGQLTKAQASSGNPNPNYLKQWYYGYDPGANRTAVQTNTVTRARLGGTITAGDTLTITVSDSALSGGQQAVNYVVQAGDTLATAAAGLAAVITATPALQAIGVNAAANGQIVNIKSASPNITTYQQSTSGGATETIALGVTDNFVENAVIGGTKRTGDVLTITFKDQALAGGLKAVPYTVLAADTLTTIAAGLTSAINADSSLAAIGVSATSVGTAITIKSNSQTATTYSQSKSNGATETITLSINQNGPQTAAISGTVTAGDVITLTAYDSGLTGGLQAVAHTVQSGDTPASIAAALASAINANANLQAVAVSATASGQVITLNSNSLNETTYRASTNSTATEVVALNIPPNGVQTAAVGGTITAGDTLTVTVFDAGLAGGSKANTYTVQTGDTLASVATGIAAMLNGDSSLTGIGVSAAAVSTVVNISSASINATTYSRATSGGATSTLALTPATAATQYGYNNLNEMTSIGAGGATRFQGSANKALTAATINGSPATLEWTQAFSGNASLSSGNNAVPVSGTDGAGTTKTDTHQISTIGSPSATPTFDANGNMTSDGTNTYEWDAENRLIKINYPGIGNNSQMTYDGIGHCVKIVEVAGGSTTSSRQFVWSSKLVDNEEIKELRDGVGAILSKYFGYGQTNSGSNYFYTRDQITSVRELLASAATIQSQYGYSPFGQVVNLQNGGQSDFQFGGYYVHLPSGLNLTVYRAYHPGLGRWGNRDPMEEWDGPNLFSYVQNAPINLRDPLGLQDSGRALANALARIWGPPPGAVTSPVCVPRGSNESEEGRRKHFFTPPYEGRPPFTSFDECADWCYNRFGLGSAYDKCMDWCEDWYCMKSNKPRSHKRTKEEKEKEESE
ncbi:MAG: hypothetical protein IPK73_12760 [Candidatus Obscuribacter sp.]|nr:hypothetical protein [Candidatus Obscuribacter sp.]